MNAPETAAAPDDALLVARAPLDHFGASATNRKHDPAYINNVLAPSLVPDGVLQPISARPYPNEDRPGIKARPNPAGCLYEIIIGEGRWLAARAAKLDAIPFFWRDIDDRTALRMQLVENLKRKDLTEIEEAEGYRRLMKDHGLTADQVAQEIGVEGKSRSYVYGRLKLLDLCPAALKIARDHNLDASLLLLAARIPDEKLQISAIKDMSPRYDGDVPMPYRRAHDMVQRTYMLKLAEAPFSRADVELLPAAGRCHECPKRTGNAADLFADIKSADICTDPGCYNAKAEAHIKKQRAAAKADGLKVIDGDAAKKIKPYQFTTELGGGFVDLDAKVSVAGGKQQTVRAILGTEAKPEALLIDPHQKGHTVEMVATATVKDMLKAKGASVPTSIERRGKSDAEKESERKRKQEAMFRQRLFDSTRGAVAVSFDTREEDSVLDQREFRQVADLLYHCLQFEEQKRLARLWIGPTEKTDDHELVRQLKKRIAEMTRKDCARLMLEASLAGEVAAPTYGSNAPENLLATAEALGVDAAAIKKGVISEMREKEKAKVKPAPKAKPAAAKVQPKTADSSGATLQIGDRVKVKNDVRGPSNHLRKCCGREGTIEEIEGDGAYYTVRFGPKAHEIVTNLVWNDLDKLPAEAAKPVSTPPDAAHAAVKGATAAPRYRNASGQTWSGRGKKPKWIEEALSQGKTLEDFEAKANPAPASPANEPAAPAKAPKLDTWPFPTGVRP